MTRIGALLALVLFLPSGTALAKKQHFGVFGTINGKKFRATSSGKPTDQCVNGIYNTTGGVVFGALECRGARHRRMRKNAKFLAIACGIVTPGSSPPIPPFEAPCIAAGYTEYTTKRGIPVSMKEWTSTFSLTPGADGTLEETSSVNIRIDAFDGTYVRGALFGVFDMPLQAGTPTAAPISGEVVFSFPVKGVQ